ncbi:MAG: hypothetical protein KDF65_11455 [Anaerolineae bacterium]|nr:hypothetical protein [Anaerolineae bacterium]
MKSAEFVYKDRLGKIIGSMTNDGEEVRVFLGKWEFVGTEFNDLEPKNKEALPDRFNLHHNALCDCTFDFKMPILINNKQKLMQSELSVMVKLGKPDSRGGLDNEEYRISLTYDGTQVYSSGKSGWFEDELLEIQKQMSKKVFIKSCINCQFSDYSPYGHGAFGAMMCFRNLKQEYNKVQTKTDFWKIHDRYDRFVQETFICDEFQRRVPGTGYRG